MGQIFNPSANSVFRLVLVGSVVLGMALFWFFEMMQRSSYYTDRAVVRSQPIPFSHEHHVGGLGIDCRYCHTSVEVSSFAGMPPSKTCMNCHAQIWTNAEMLQPVRASYQTGTPLRWTRVNNLPDYVYFDHSIHIHKGVGCSDCHGPVDRMPLMYPAASLQMEWCLNCHREPEKFLRPRSQVFNMRYSRPTTRFPVVMDGKAFTDQLTLGNYLKSKYYLRSAQDIISCSTCHR
jgi:Cytochrome c7 and related cytochrome c